MGAMGGPVGGSQQMNADTPNSGVQINPIKRLNTAIYDHLLRNNLTDVAKSFSEKVDIEYHAKKSPGQQANGIDDSMEVDNVFQNLPDGMDPPVSLGGGLFLQDWWCQFWEMHQGLRAPGKLKQSTMVYVAAQRQAQKARTNMMAGGNMDAASMQNMRVYNNNMMQMNNGMNVSNDLKRAAMQNRNNMYVDLNACMTACVW